MGKAKPRHKTNRKQSSFQPIGLPSVRDLEREEPEQKSADSDHYLNIVDEIQSPDSDTRLCGLRSLVTLSEIPENVVEILEKKIIKIIAPFLAEKNSEVRNLTAGVLRNLSACGNEEVNSRLVKDDVMTPVLAVWAQYDNEWSPEKSSVEDTDTLLQLINILWNLCESDETALKYFNCSNVVSLLLRCLDHQAVGIDLAIAACHCLNSVSEDNPSVASALRSREADLLRLLSEPATTHKKLLLSTLVAAIVSNLGARPAAALAAIGAALAADARQLICQLSSDLPPDDRPLSDDCESRLTELTALVEAQTVALETLANLVSAADDDMDVEASESDDDGEWETERETGGNLDETSDSLSGLDNELAEGLANHGITFAVVFSKADPLPKNVMDILNASSYSRRLANKAELLQCRALLCLNNLVSPGGTALDETGGAPELYRAAGLITARHLTDFDATSAQHAELLEASTAAVRAILVRLSLEKFTEVADVEPKHLQVLFGVGAKSEDSRVRANVARTVAALGTMLLSTADQGRPLVQMIGGHLLETAERELAGGGGGGGVWLACEALDCLVDLFADDRTDAPTASLKMVDRLRAIAPRLKAKVRQERKKLGEHSATVSTVMSNLGPFVKYKAGRVGT